MAQNFLACDRDQELLLPPSLRAWLPEGHLAWFVIDAVGQLDLSAFLAAYRVDGHGRAAHDPAMMVALLLYAYAIGERSSRRIERRCVEDVAARVICANQAPDHTTIARFRQRHETALAELFGEVLALCAEASAARRALGRSACVSCTGHTRRASCVGRRGRAGPSPIGGLGRRRSRGSRRSGAACGASPRSGAAFGLRRRASRLLVRRRP